MIYFWIGLGVITGIALVYVTIGRDRLKKVPAFRGFFEWAESWEITLWKKSETLMWSRFLMVMGLVPPFLQQVETILQSLGAVNQFLPPEHQMYYSLALTVVGAVNELLRWRTTKPIEIVAVPEDASPEMKNAVNSVDLTNKIAVAVVRELKREGEP